jgi:hypothetical protein
MAYLLNNNPSFIADTMKNLIDISAWAYARLKANGASKFPILDDSSEVIINDDGSIMFTVLVDDALTFPIQQCLDHYNSTLSFLVGAQDLTTDESTAISNYARTKWAELLTT